MWELSLLVLHMRIRESCPPNLDEFLLSSKPHQRHSVATTNATTSRSPRSLSLLTAGTPRTGYYHPANPNPRRGRKRRRKYQIDSNFPFNSSRSLKNKMKRNFAAATAAGNKPITSGSSSSSSSITNSRANTDVQYVSFKATANETYAKELRLQNDLDLALYLKAVELLCQHLHKFNLWSYPEVIYYWRSRSPVLDGFCS